MLFVSVKGAEDYDVIVINRWGTVVYVGGGAITTNPVNVWDGTKNRNIWGNSISPVCLSDGGYSVLVNFSNCDHTKNAAQTVEILGSPCRLPNPDPTQDNRPDYNDAQSAPKDTLSQASNPKQQLPDDNENTSNQSSIQIHPNPTPGKFQLTVGSWQSASIYIYNILGEIVYTSSIIHQPLTIDISYHPKGIYLIKVISNEKVFVERIIYQ